MANGVVRRAIQSRPALDPAAEGYPREQLAPENPTVAIQQHRPPEPVVAVLTLLPRPSYGVSNAVVAGEAYGGRGVVGEVRICPPSP